MNSVTLGGSLLLSVKRDIETMRTRGAAEIGKQAALALAHAAQAYHGDSVVGLQVDLIEAARLLASARPTAVTLRNALNHVLSALDGARTVSTARAQLRRSAQAYVRDVEAAKGLIAAAGAKLLRTDRAVLTHCHSTLAQAVLVEAARKNRRLRVFSTETRPFRQGLITSRNLAQAGVDVTLILDSAATYILETEKVSKIVLGADTITADGTVYNKIGTRQLCIVAQHLKVPVLVCAETQKFSPYSLRGEPVPIEERNAREVADPEDVPGVRIRNPVFDATPPRYVHRYVTEKGVLESKRVRPFAERLFRDVTLWI